MDFKIQVLGCGDAFGSGGRLHSAFWLEIEDKIILMECGATIGPAMKRQNKSTDDVDVILISHLHGDHYGGIPFFLLNAAKIQKRKKPLTLIGPVGMEEEVHALQRLLYQGAEDIFEAFPIEFVELQPGQVVSYQNVHISAYDAEHSPQVLPMSLRIEAGGKVLAFSGDTSWVEDLVPLSENADLFICECNFYEGDHTSHLSYEVLRRNLVRLKMKRIVLTHLGESMIEMLERIEMEVAAEGQTYLL